MKVFLPLILAAANLGASAPPHDIEARNLMPDFKRVCMSAGLRPDSAAAMARMKELGAQYQKGSKPEKYSAFLVDIDSHSVLAMIYRDGTCAVLVKGAHGQATLSEFEETANLVPAGFASVRAPTNEGALRMHRRVVSEFYIGDSSTAFSLQLMEDGDGAKTTTSVVLSMPK